MDYEAIVDYEKLCREEHEAVHGPVEVVAEPVELDDEIPYSCCPSASG